MTEIMLMFGSKVRTADNKISGYVKSLIVEPSTSTVNYLVVELKFLKGSGRLVPLDHVDASAGKIRLRYTEAEFNNHLATQTLVEFPSDSVELVTEGWQLEDDDEPAAVDGRMISPIRSVFAQEADLIRYPPTDKEIQRGDYVLATDGEIGQLRALCIDPRTHQMTHVHVLLKERHLWRHKEVAIPYYNVSGFTGGIHLNISKQQVQDLAHGDVDHPNG